MKTLVNPISVKDCKVVFYGAETNILDISFLRLIIQSTEVWAEFPENESLFLDVILDSLSFSSSCKIVGKGNEWIRLHFEKMTLSSQAKLHSFLSPQKIGESLIRDWETNETRHFHGLNETELWFSKSGSTLFTYLDSKNTTYQFVIRISDLNSSFIIGKVLRHEYIELTSIDSELRFLPLNERELFCVLGECRDIVTNFRPVNQVEFALKQKLFRIINDHLYSESKKIGATKIPSPYSVALFSHLEKNA